MKKGAMLWEKLDGNRVHCNLCAHHCKIANLKFGACRVRQNVDGSLYTLVYDRSIAANIDPIEKKPLYHFLPGSSSYSIATVGCNFQCSFCQNWQISQVSDTEGVFVSGFELPVQHVIEEATKYKCASISYTYTEPTIFFEYAYDIARLAREANLANVFVTNGFMTRQALESIAPYLDAANVDLKSFNDKYYKTTCKARLQPVLDTIAYMKKLDIWVELTTLLIPGENDSDEELNQIASFIAALDTNIPWHISRFHPDYQYTDYDSTSIETMYRAREIGRGHGLLYVYLGNVAEGSDTHCPTCGQLLVKRSFFGVEDNKIQDGKCSQCSTQIVGRWEQDTRNKAKAMAGSLRTE